MLCSQSTQTKIFSCSLQNLYVTVTEPKKKKNFWAIYFSSSFSLARHERDDFFSRYFFLVFFFTRKYWAKKMSLRCH